MVPTRRGVLAGAPVIGLAATGTAAAAPSDPAEATALQAVLERYAGFGIKASGGAGDEACGVWLEGELGRLGYALHRQSFPVPWFEPQQTTLVCGEARATVVPQGVVQPTGPRGLTAPLRLASERGDLTGAIAVVVLPYARWVSLAQPDAARPLAEAVRRGAAAVVLVTTGPTSEVIALNVSSTRPGVERPVALLAPKDAGPVLAAAAEGRTATLTVHGRGGRAERRPAWNLIARLDRGAKETIVVSTPRSGWFTCAAERGSGLAVWLSLGRWLSRAARDVNVLLLATSGHEYEYVGGEHFLAEAAPSPAATRLWVHVGASAACRDWQELGPRLFPLPSADSQRFLTATAGVLLSTRAAFQGITGLEAAYLADKAMAGGELTNVLNAGYSTAIGLYGIHRYFHTPADDLRCVSGELVAPVATAFRRAVSAAANLPLTT